MKHMSVSRLFSWGIVAKERLTNGQKERAALVPSLQRLRGPSGPGDSREKLRFFSNVEQKREGLAEKNYPKKRRVDELRKFV